VLRSRSFFEALATLDQRPKSSRINTYAPSRKCIIAKGDLKSIRMNTNKKRPASRLDLVVTRNGGGASLPPQTRALPSRACLRRAGVARDLLSGRASTEWDRAPDRAFVSDKRHSSVIGNTGDYGNREMIFRFLQDFPSISNWKTLLYAKCFRCACFSLVFGAEDPLALTSSSASVRQHNCLLVP
jgi:hypothetical protein